MVMPAEIPGKGCTTCGSEPEQVPYGGSEFYQARYDDFKRRHPGMEPPSYYLGYGKKYADRFMNETYKTLSPAGQAWLLRARRNLQEAIEKERQKDPIAFDKLEQNDAAFKKFAYDTHPKAYVDAGLLNLPASDLVKIGLTPDGPSLKGGSQAWQDLKSGHPGDAWGDLKYGSGDLLTKDGLKQVWEVTKSTRPSSIWNITKSTVTNDVPAAGSWVSSKASNAWQSVSNWWNK